MAKINFRKASMVFIFITITLDMIGIGLIIPTLPDIMRRFTTDANLVSQYFGFFISTYAAMQFLASPLLGVLSDMFGRRSILLVSLLVAAMDYVLMAYAPSLPILFIGRVVAGLTGASMTVAMAYIADISDDKNRSQNFGMIGAAFGLGFIIGPALGGLIGHAGPQYPFLVAAGMNFLNFLFGLFVLPESLSPELRRKFSISRINPFYALRKIFSNRSIFLMMLIYFLFQMAGQTHPSIWTLYTETRFGWTTTQVGLSLALVGLLSAIAQGGLTRIIIPKLGEYKTVLYSAIGQAVCYFLYGLATEGWMMYAVLVLSFMFWVAPPALQSLLSKKTPSNEQGELQGSLVGLSSLSAIMNPIISTQLFSQVALGAPYFFAALMSLLSFIILFQFRNKVIG